jgi:AbiV family abortive infection protein
MKFKDPFKLLDAKERAAVEQLLDRYKGHLSVRQIADGIAVTLANAREIHQDALLLAAAGRYPRCVALLVSSLEELGKINVLSQMARIPKSNQSLWADAWESFRSHQHKATWGFARLSR